MTREEALELESCIRYNLTATKHKEAGDFAFAALREQEERSKGCEFCQEFDDPCGVPMLATEEDECDRGIYLYNGWLCANGGSFCEAKVKFCPMCGRRLEE